jgi:MFS family permease
MREGINEPAAPMAPVMREPRALYRNRNYNVLWFSLLLSELGSELVFVAFPLLVLATSGSAVQIGLVASVLAVSRMVATLPAGVIADRCNRKWMMLLCQGVRVVAVGSLAVAKSHSFWHLLVVAAVEGAFSAAFEPAEHATLPDVVPESQLSAAIARNSARPFVALLVGPTLAGVAFTFYRYLPFAIDGGMLAVSVLALSLLRLPARAAASPGRLDESAGTEAAEGIRSVLTQPVIRATLIWMVLVNLVFNALIVIILALSGEDHVGPAQIGLMMACLGAGGLVGGVFAARLHAALPAPLIIIGGSWVIAVVTGLMLLTPGGLVFGILLGVGAFVAPIATTTVMTYQMMATPAGLRGRLSGVVGLCSGIAASLGPMAGGVLVKATSLVSIVICAACLGIIALTVTFSRTMRHFPSS